jgi:hypothetical protein
MAVSSNAAFCCQRGADGSSNKHLASGMWPRTLSATVNRQRSPVTMERQQPVEEQQLRWDVGECGDLCLALALRSQFLLFHRAACAAHSACDSLVSASPSARVSLGL